MAAPVQLAAVDAGSNAIRLVIARATSPHHLQILENERVAVRLGHSSTAVTQNVYQHRVEQLDRAAAEKVAGMLFGARKKLTAD